MEHRRSKLALFFAAQALAVAAMIVLLQEGRRTHCDPDGCWQASGVSVVFALLVIFGELWILASALRVDGPVWKTLAGLGILSLIVAVFATGTACCGLHTRSAIAPVVAVWHLAAGMLLLVAGSAAGAWDLVARLRRPDGLGPENGGSSAMWPLD